MPRFRGLLRAEILATLHDPTDAPGELLHLIAIASRGAEPAGGRAAASV